MYLHIQGLKVGRSTCWKHEKWYGDCTTKHNIRLYHLRPNTTEEASGLRGRAENIII